MPRAEPDQSKTLYLGSTELRWTPGSSAVDVARHYPGGTIREFDGSLSYAIAGHQRSVMAKVDATSGAISHTRDLPSGEIRSSWEVTSGGFRLETVTPLGGG